MSYGKKKKKPYKSSKFNKALFKIFFWALGIIAIFVLALIGIAAFYEEGIGKLVVAELKKSLKTDLDIETAELSLVWQFPQASVSLKNVKLRDESSDTIRYLLTAKDISLKCSMFGLLAGNYEFTSIEINDASIYVRHDKRGLGNYNVFKPSTDTSTTPTNSKLNLSINDARFNNVTLEYIDEKVDQAIKVNIKDAFFEGSFTDEKYDMKSYANIVSKYIKIGEDSYLKDKELGYNAIININNIDKTYQFKDITVTVEANQFNTNGKIAVVPEGTQMDISFNSNKARLGSLLKLLPSSFEKSLGGFESTAKLNFEAKINGIYSEKSLPAMDVKFGLKSGRVSHPKMKSDLKGVGFEISFKNKGGKSSNDAHFEVQNFKASLGGYPIELKLVMDGLDNPDIDFSFNGTVPLKGMYQLMGEQVTKGQGEIQINELFLKGKLNDMINPRRISRVQLGGTINFADAGIIINTVPIKLEKGTLQLKDNILSITDLFLRTPKNDMRLDGNFQNILPVLFSDSLNSQHAELGFRARLISEKIDADEFIKAFTFNTVAPEGDNSQTEVLKDSLHTLQNENRAFITQFLHGQFKAEIGELKYGKVLVQNFKGELSFENSTLKLQGITLDAMKGKMGLNAKVVFQKEPYLLAFLECANVDIKEFFAQTENFGQTTMTDKNIRGQLNSIIKINAFWDAKGKFLDNELVVIADVNLKQGEIINFAMLESFSKYIKIDDLRHIRFTELRNQFKIENRQFHMPAMFIQSNALNLTIAGTHSFDQDIDYKFKINAGQVIAQKFKQYNPDGDPLPAKEKGVFNIYARYHGNLNGTPEFKMGKKNVKKYLDHELNEELALMGNTLRAEFEKSDLFSGHLAPQSGQEAAKKVSTLREPTGWGDNREGDSAKEEELEYIEGW